MASNEGLTLFGQCDDIAIFVGSSGPRAGFMDLCIYVDNENSFYVKDTNFLTFDDYDKLEKKIIFIFDDF